MTTNFDVARDVVRKVGGDPNNTAIVRAVAVWLRFESGHTIIGNNPWNITGKGSCGSRTARNGQHFAVYCSIGDGTTATASLLKSNKAYAGIVQAIRAGNALGFFTALVKSPWDAGHYNGGAALVTAWRSSLSGREVPLTFVNPGTGSSSSGSTSGSDATLASFTFTDWQSVLQSLGISTDPTHVISHEEAGKIADEYIRRGVLPSSTRDQIIAAFDGKTVAQAFQGNATDPVTAVANAIGGIGQSFAGIANVFGFLLDPENWKYIIAIFVGIPLALFGFYLLAGVNTGPREAV